MFTQWYKGGNATAIPVWTGGPVAFHTGTTNSNSGAGTLVGYVNNMRYGEVSTCGTLGYQLFRDIRVPANPVTIRIVGIVQQQSSYIVIAWETVPGTPATTDMPPFTWKMRVNGTTTYDFTSAPAAGTNAPSISRYLNVAPGWSTNQDKTIEFI